jgi:hypothetical protein
MNSRPAHRTSSPPRPFTSRYATPPEPLEDEEGVNSLRIGGWVMLVVAVGHLVQRFVVSQWVQLESDQAQTIGVAVFDALLGVAMLQGSEVARKVVLVLSILATLFMGLGLLGLSYIGFTHLWPIAASGLATGLGLCFMAWARRGSVIRVALGLLLLIGGWVGSVVSAIVLIGVVDLGTIKMIRQWSAPERTFTTSELDLKLPPGWVTLKAGSPLSTGDPAPLLVLANTEVIGFVRVYREVRSYSTTDTVEYYLDSVVKQLGNEHPGAEQVSRTDTSIGGTTARRALVAWSARPHDEERRGVHGYVTAWRDVDVFSHVVLFGPRAITKRLEQEMGGVERALAFTAPRTKFLRESVSVVRTACPVLSDQTILMMSRVIPEGSAPETYCRAAYRLALGGQVNLNPESKERLRGLMRTLFDAIPKTQIGPFGAYVERLNSGGASTPAEDRQLTESLRAAVDALPPAVQEDVRSYFGIAIDMGLLGAVRR